eukprot:scaffold2015_cov186-Amphora_coffeaeformis.AAC.8
MGTKARVEVAAAMNNKSNLRIVKQKTNRQVHRRRDGRIVEAIVHKKILGTETAITRAAQQYNKAKQLKQSVQSTAAKKAFQEIQSALGQTKVVGGGTVASRAKTGSGFLKPVGMDWAYT